MTLDPTAPFDVGRLLADFENRLRRVERSSGHPGQVLPVVDPANVYSTSSTSYADVARFDFVTSARGLALAYTLTPGMAVMNFRLFAGVGDTADTVLHEQFSASGDSAIEIDLVEYLGASALGSLVTVRAQIQLASGVGPASLAFTKAPILKHI